MQMLMSWYTSKQDVPDRDIIPYMGLIDVFYPKICVGCRSEGEYICQRCQRKLVVPDPVCPLCSQSSPGGWVHVGCKTRFGMDRLLVGLEYHGMVQRCLKKVKYKSSWEIVDFLFTLCRFELSEGIVVAVPMYSQKERERGFNQSERITQLLSTQTGLPHLSPLRRVRHTQPMYGLTKEERQENVAGAFALQRNHLHLQRVILVDDVWTTGSTMQVCTEILKQAGVEEVWGVALAR
jgi:competence protein ComFC